MFTVDRARAKLGKDYPVPIAASSARIKAAA
jgi:hypothetical protein